MTDQSPFTAATLIRLAQPLLQRDDVVVCIVDTIAQPACFDRDTAQIRVRSDLLDDEPLLLGALVHQIGRADHSPLFRGRPDVVEWAEILEGGRVDMIMARRFPDLRVQLSAASAAALDGRGVVEPIDAIEELIRIAGGAQAGVLQTDDYTRRLADARALLVGDHAATVEGLAVQAVDAADDGFDVVWCAEQVAQIAASYGPRSPSAAQREHTSQASSGLGAALPVDWGRRTATAAEWRAVKRIRSWATGDTDDHRRHVESPSATPPGSIRMAELVRATAQADLGLTVTATPWRRRAHAVGVAPVEVGLIVDRSSSMESHLEKASIAAWTLRHAFAGTSGRTQAWVFANDVVELDQLDRRTIVTPSAGPQTTALADAFRAYREWTRDVGSRVLIVVTDGRLHGEPVAPLVDGVLADGVRVVVICPDESSVSRVAANFPADVGTDIGDSCLLDRLRALVDVKWARR